MLCFAKRPRHRRICMTLNLSALAPKPMPSTDALRLVRAFLATLLLTWLSACGGGGGGGGGTPPTAPTDPGVAGAPYFTFSVGDRWRALEGGVTYTTRVTRQDGAGLVLQQVGDDGSVEETVLERSESGVSLVPAASADAITAAIGRYDIVRFPLRAGTSYTAVDRTLSTFDLDGDGRADSLQVRVQVSVIGFERITVPAGTFDNALRLRTVITQTAVLGAGTRTVRVTGTSDDWYASGVGPVRSLLVISGDSGTQTNDELLIDYRVGSLSNDTVAPSVASRTPAPDSLGRNASVQIVFSETIERPTLPAQAITVRDAVGQAIPGRSEWQNGRTLVFVPEGAGAFATGRYTVALNGSPQDWAGNSLPGTVQWSFAVDGTGPVLVARTPADGAVDVAPDAVFSFTFDEDLSPAVATNGSVTLTGPNGPLPINVRVQGKVLSLVPAAPLERGQPHSIFVGQVLDLLDNPASFGLSTSFTTDPGRFALPRTLRAFEGRRVPFSTLGDIDGDGRVDLVAIEQDLAGGFGGTTRILRRGTDGRFADAGIAVPGLNCNGALHLADIDADGRVDVLTAAPFCGLQWAGQNADSSFSFRATIASNVAEVRPIAIAGSTRPALAFIDNSRNLRLLRPSGASGFSAAQTLHSGADAARTLLVTDIDGDGRHDLLAQLVIGGNNVLLIARQLVDGSFATELRPTPEGNLMLAADLTGDGRVDLLLQPTWPSTQLVLQPQAVDGSFATPGETFVLPGRAGNTIALADIDGDGRPDLTMPVLNARGEIVQFVRLARRSDGGFQLTPLLEYEAAGAFVAGDLHIGDFSGDGRADLLFGGLLVAGRSTLAAPSGTAAGTPIQRLMQAATRPQQR
jgi:hypothetical protein